MQPFVYASLPSRIVFGAEARTAVAEELKRLGASRAMVLSTPEQAYDAYALASALGESAVEVFAGAVMHTPAVVTDQALAVLQGREVDILVALGGGSTIGLSKALALRTDLPQIAIPTTYAGSEVTPIIGETRDGQKSTQRTWKVLPEAVIYDVDLTLTLPIGLTVTSGLNAIAHAVEALYARDANPVTSLLAIDGITKLSIALRRLTEAPSDRDARSDALYGAWACGTCLGTVGMALHHKLCHVLGGSFGLPHSETHAVVLPHVVAFNLEVSPVAMARIARALEARRADQGLFDFARSVGAPASLAELGLPESALDRAADLAMAGSYWNPRQPERGDVRALLENAYHGRRPGEVAG